MDLASLIQGGLYTILFLVAAGYASYMIGLIRVLRRIGRLNWQAFVPILNFYAQVRAVGAPKKWFFLALIPYVGVPYYGSMAIRLGAVFGKSIPFSLIWLTFGAFIGMHIIARSPRIDEDLLNKPLRLADIRAIRRKLWHKKI